MKKEYFVKVPNWIARSAFLSPYSKTLYVAIVSYNPSFPSYSQLVKDTGIKSKTTIRKCLKELVLFDLIKIIKGGFNTSNTYVINPKPLNGILQQNMNLTTSGNETCLVQEMEPNKINIKISNKGDEVSSALNTEDPHAKPATEQETNESLSEILNGIQ